MSAKNQDLVDNMFAAHDIDIPYDPQIYDAHANNESGSDNDEFLDLTDEMAGLPKWYVDIKLSFDSVPNPTELVPVWIPAITVTAMTYR